MPRPDDPEQQYLDKLRAAVADDPIALEGLNLIIDAQAGLSGGIGRPGSNVVPISGSNGALDQPVEPKPSPPTKPSGWSWRRFRR